MGTYVVTGAASGMGGAAAAKLREEGHTVIGVDLKEGDVIADLSKDVSRQRAAREVLELADGNLDGAVIAAGVGPIPGKENVELILQVNYYGAVKMLEELRPALAKNGNAKAVLVGSNSTTTMPLVPGFAVNALLKGQDRCCRQGRRRLWRPRHHHGLWRIQDCRHPLGTRQCREA